MRIRGWGEGLILSYERANRLRGTSMQDSREPRVFQLPSLLHRALSDNQIYQTSIRPQSSPLARGERLDGISAVLYAPLERLGYSQVTYRRVTSKRCAARHR